MTYYINSGNRFDVASGNEVAIHNNLPAGVYMVRLNPATGSFYLETAKEFDEPKKLYGDAYSQANRVIRSFNDRNKSMGVLLAGVKGSGKSVTAKLISTYGMKQYDLPTLIVDQPFCNDVFKGFIQKIDQECIILFDEFDKVYDYKDQSEILTLFDGVYQGKKLFILTVNERVNNYLYNRPGRMYYLFDYNGIGESFIREYCEDLLNNKEWTSQIVNLSGLFSNFNVDSLASIVEECNRYNEPPMEVVKYLNTRAETERCDYTVQLESLTGLAISHDAVWGGMPLSHNIVIDWYIKDDEDSDESVTFTTQDLVSVKGDEMVFQNNKFKLTLKKSQKQKLDYSVLV